MIRWCVGPLLHTIGQYGTHGMICRICNVFVPYKNSTCLASSSSRTESTLPKASDKDQHSATSDRYELGSEVSKLQHLSKTELEIWATQQLENLSAEDEKRLKILKLEYHSFESLGQTVPIQMTNRQWLEILQHADSVSARLKRYKFFHHLEEKALEKEKKKLAKLEQLKAEELIDEESRYLFIQSGAKLKYHYNNLYHAMKFGHDVIFDFGFEDHMTPAEISRLVTQMKRVYNVNKCHRDPYHIHMCNVNRNGNFYRQLHVSFNRVGKTFDYPITVSDKHYLDFFPKEQLFYLSPHSKEILRDYDPNAVYIIGGIINNTREEPLSSAKAKREGIRCAKLPIDIHLDWRQGSKSLSLIYMIRIMLTLRDTDGNWKQAFKHIPPRKLKQPVTMVTEK